MKDANIYTRRNGAFGASCDGCLDTGHHIVEGSGRFIVYSIKDGETVIAAEATRQEAERAIAEDWRTAE